MFGGVHYSLYLRRFIVSMFTPVSQVRSRSTTCQSNLSLIDSMEQKRGTERDTFQILNTVSSETKKPKNTFMLT